MVYPKTMAIPPIPDGLRPLTATELRWKEYETFSEAYKNAKFVEHWFFKAWCKKHNPVYINAPCNLSSTHWFRDLLECYHKETKAYPEKKTINFDMFVSNTLSDWFNKMSFPRSISKPSSVPPSNLRPV